MILGWQLKQRQSLNLEAKEFFSEKRIREWYDYWNGDVYVSFSGGKDSTVLLSLVRKLYPNVKAVFIDTGLEFPEIRKFVKTIDNVIWIRPKISFKKVIEKYGYPVISKEIAQKIEEIRNTKSEKLKNKRLWGDIKGNGKLPEKWKYLLKMPFKISSKCCNVLKKSPIRKFEKLTGLKPFIGLMASDSSLRTTSYLKTGCNSFVAKRPVSLPLSIWNESDVWQYIKKYKIPYSKIYDMGYTRTGCMFCMFGIHLESQNRFEKMKQTHNCFFNYFIKLGGEKVLKSIKNYD